MSWVAVLLLKWTAQVSFKSHVIIFCRSDYLKSDQSSCSARDWLQRRLCVKAWQRRKNFVLFDRSGFFHRNIKMTHFGEDFSSWPWNQVVQHLLPPFSTKNVPRTASFFSFIWLKQSKSTKAKIKRTIEESSSRPHSCSCRSLNTTDTITLLNNNTWTV